MNESEKVDNIVYLDKANLAINYYRNLSFNIM